MISKNLKYVYELSIKENISLVIESAYSRSREDVHIAGIKSISKWNESKAEK